MTLSTRSLALSALLLLALIPSAALAQQVYLLPGTWHDANRQAIELSVVPLGGRSRVQASVTRPQASWHAAEGALRGARIELRVRRGRARGAVFRGRVDPTGTLIFWDDRTSWQLVRTVHAIGEPPRVSGGPSGEPAHPQPAHPQPAHPQPAYPQPAQHTPPHVQPTQPTRPAHGHRPKDPPKGAAPPPERLVAGLARPGEHSAYAALQARGEVAWLSEADTRAGVKWIIAMMNREARGFCWKDSHVRGAGKPLSDCPAGQEKDGALCYPRCKPGYTGVGPVCWQKGCKPGYHNDGALCGRRPHSYASPSRTADCPAGYKNHGANCGRPPHRFHTPSRVASCPPGYKNTGPAGCHRPMHTYGKGCTTVFKKYKCKPGYSDHGCLCTRPPHNTHNMRCPKGYFLRKALGRCYKTCPSGYRQTAEFCERKGLTLGMGSMRCRPGEFKRGARCYKNCKAGYTQTGESCHKPAHSYPRKSYGRSAGKPMTCRAGLEQDAGLCYPSCRPGHKGVGPVCWRKCPGSRPVECAAGCATSKAECAEKTINQVVAPLEMVANIAGLVLTGGTANAAKQAAKAGTKAAVKTAVRLSVKQMAKQVARRMARKLGKTVRSKLVKRGVKLRKTLTKRGMAKHTAEVLAKKVSEYLFQRGAESIVAASMANDEPSLVDHLRDLAVLDPTGTAEVVAAYAHSKCGADPELPRFSSIQY